MQKIAILLLATFMYLNMNSQQTLKALTDYKTERKSFQFVASSGEYLLVDNGEFYLDVLSVDDEGQLYKVFESELPFCNEGESFRADLSKTHIMFNYEDHLIFQNFHTGDIHRIDNIPQGENYKSPYTYFVDSNYYVINTDKNYLYRLNDHTLINGYGEVPEIRGNLFFSQQIVNNKTIFQIVNTLLGDTILLPLNDYEVFYYNNFEGMIYQRQVYPNNNVISDKYVLFILNQNGQIDSTNRALPKFSFGVKSKNDNSLILTSFQKIMSTYAYVFYKYDLQKDSLMAIDTFQSRNISYQDMVSDSVYFYYDDKNYYIYNIYTRENTKVEVPTDVYFNYQVGSKLIFMGDYFSIYVFDYKSKKLSELTGSDILNYKNFNRISKQNKEY